MKVAIQRTRGLRFFIRIMGSRRLRRASSIMMATYGNMMVTISSKCLKRTEERINREKLLEERTAAKIKGKATNKGVKKRVIMERGHRILSVI